AKAFLAVQKEFGSFDSYIWSFVGGQPIRNHWKSSKDIPARTAESDAMSKDLLRREFKFVGSTICYAFMQAVGIVNDHLIDSFRHDAGAAPVNRRRPRAVRRPAFIAVPHQLSGFQFHAAKTSVGFVASAKRVQKPFMINRSHPMLLENGAAPNLLKACAIGL